jgi:hypothetical protein
MPEAKLAVEQLVERREVTVYVPMLEDAAAFEAELRELGVHAAKEAAAAE